MIFYTLLMSFKKIFTLIINKTIIQPRKIMRTFTLDVQFGFAYHLALIVCFVEYEKVADLKVPVQGPLTLH